MKKSFRTEFHMLANRSQFQAMLFFGVILAVAAFSVDCFQWFGARIDRVPTAYGSWIGASLYSHLIAFMIFILLPLYASISYSDMSYVSQKSGYSNFILTRSSRKACVLSNAVAVFVSGFAVVALPLLLNQLLCLIAFPIDGIVDAGTATYKSIRGFFTYPLGGLAYHYPYLYNILYCLIPAFFGGAFALLTTAFSYWMDKGRVALFILPFLLYTFSTFILEITSNETYSIYSYLRGSGGVANLSAEWIPYLFLTTLGISVVLLLTAPKERFGIEQNI